MWGHAPNNLSTPTPHTILQTAPDTMVVAGMMGRARRGSRHSRKTAEQREVAPDVPYTLTGPGSLCQRSANLVHAKFTVEGCRADIQATCYCLTIAITLL
jgi:hypothetical protein